MNKQIIARILLGLQLTVLSLLISNAFKSNEHLRSPFVPQVIRTTIQQQLVLTVTLSATGFVLAAVAHYFSKYLVAISISIICTFYMLFPGVFPLVAK